MKKGVCSLRLVLICVYSLCVFCVEVLIIYYRLLDCSLSLYSSLVLLEIVYYLSLAVIREGYFYKE